MTTLKPSQSNPQWLSDGQPGIQIRGNSVMSQPNVGGDYHRAMWVDGEGINSGEHYWTIQFREADTFTHVGLSTRDRFEKGIDEGLYYGFSGGLTNGEHRLIRHYGPNIASNQAIGVMASYDGPQLKIYFFHQGKPLGLAFDVPASSLQNAHPVICFYIQRKRPKTLSAKIIKETTIPSMDNRKAQLVLWNCRSLEDDIWNSQTWEIQKTFKMKCHYAFEVWKTENSWKEAEQEGYYTAGIEYCSENVVLKNQQKSLQEELVNMCKNPQRVTLNGNNMTISKHFVDAVFT